MPNVPESAGIVAKAALLYAQGMAWPAIAEAVGRAEDTVNHWPTRRAEEWDRALVAAVERMLGTLEVEGVRVVRASMRSGDPRERLMAARLALEHVRKLRATRLEITGVDGGPINVRHAFELFTPETTRELLAITHDVNGQGRQLHTDC